MLKYKKQIQEIIEGREVSCPKCKRFGLGFDSVYWKCPWRDCYCCFSTEEIPDPPIYN